MNRLVALAAALLALAPLGALAQSSATCPSLPVDAGLHWEQLDGPGFLFCKAIAEDGREAFAVTLSRESPFKPRRNARAEEATIAGRPAHWYRGEIAGRGNVVVRETLVEIDNGNLAHVSLSADSEEAAAQAMRQVQALGFQDARLSRN